MSRVSCFDLYALFSVAFVLAVSPGALGMSFLSNYQDGPRFYPYSRDQIWDFTEKMGYPKLFDWQATRNSDGTELRLYSEHLKRTVIFSCEGWKKELAMPGARAWLNDSFEFVAWGDDQQRSHFSNGESGNFVFNYNSVDPAGKYFLEIPKWQRDRAGHGYARIYSVDHPRSVLAEIRIGALARIDSRDSKVTVVGDEAGNGMNDRLLAIVLERQDDKLTEISEKTVMRPDGPGSSPFYAVDISPWDNEMVVTSVYDGFPYSDLYSIDLDTMQHNKIGKGTSGFYLQCDVIRLFSEKRNHKGDPGKSVQ